MTKLPRLTPQTEAVLRVMLQDPSGEHYGREIGAAAGFKPGTVQPILAGVIASSFEDPEVAAAARRPRRLYYRFTPEGAEQVRLAIAEASQRRAEDGAALRPGYAGGFA